MIAGVLTLIGLVRVHAGALEDGIVALDKQDYSAALQLLLPLAEQGNALAQRCVGDIYSRRNLPGITNASLAVTWFAKAAAQHDAEAEYQLGLTYLYGDDEIPKDQPQGLAWLERAANAGHAHSADFLGTLYLRGWEGAPKDPAQSFFWYRRAAELGDVSGQVHVSVAYANGTGVQKNEAEALRWNRIVFARMLEKAEQGDANVQILVAIAYELGWDPDLTRDTDAALMWYRRAAALGHADDPRVKQGLARLEK